MFCFPSPSASSVDPLLRSRPFAHFAVKYPYRCLPPPHPKEYRQHPSHRKPEHLSQQHFSPPTIPNPLPIFPPLPPRAVLQPMTNPTSPPPVPKIQGSYPTLA